MAIWFCALTGKSTYANRKKIYPIKYLVFIILNESEGSHFLQLTIFFVKKA